ncbi:MAG: DUF308 domain-containing protein [Bacteroidaceae bacterium]|nr:DUF308 domain-containing protein [Bacteroidaceae bacterium]MBQ5392539.1 DUF308 domain-containing protein [Bacteroidaceae bacterium]
MKIISSYIFRSLCSLLIGLLLLFNAEQMPSIIVRVIGLLFLLPGVFGVLAYLFTNFSKTVIIRSSFPLMSIGSILFGTLLEMYPDKFVTSLVFFLGVMLLFAGFNQFSSMFVNRKVSPFSWLLMFVPLVLIGIGVYCVTHSTEAASTLFKILGATLVYYGLSDMFLALRTKHYGRIYEREQKKAAEAERRRREAEYVDFEVINANENKEEE